MYHSSATLSGVVRHDVSKSAGSSAFVGSVSPSLHAHSITSRRRSALLPPRRHEFSSEPALLQSKT